MSTKKRSWTEPGPVDYQVHDSTETRKGTAAANPVLSLAPRPATPVRRGTAGANGSGGGADHRSPAQIEADIERTRARLAGTLDELTDRLTPRAVLRQANTKARGAFVGPDGTVRTDRAAIAAGSVLSVVGGCVAVRRLRRR